MSAEPGASGQGPRPAPAGVGRRRSPLAERGVELVRRVGALVAVVLVVALVRSFVFQMYVIPSGSMEDTLMEGDRIVVTLYDIDSLQRGDVIVFTDPSDWLGEVPEPTGVRGALQDLLVAIRVLPQDPGHHLVKRVIGMPGDRVVADGQGSLTVNGVEVIEPYLKPGRSASDIAFDITVPEGYLWVMGDNRSNSADSRLHQADAHGGFVPQDHVVGVARRLIWPLSRWSALDGGTAAFAAVPEPETVPTAQPTPTPVP
ncbi:MAG: signal peptidase I [Actinomyces sp.]|uniref:signal peptidase I n=1 Tax=Actinomyces sp. TaxID=29317 RepID=UPI0026DCAF2C|nr:signal peptidase I [Actinomyces sp.]MDO4243944.1 signal peptidase I [Actinomyces sp.]